MATTAASSQTAETPMRKRLLVPTSFLPRQRDSLRVIVKELQQLKEERQERQEAEMRAQLQHSGARMIYWAIQQYNTMNEDANLILNQHPYFYNHDLLLIHSSIKIRNKA